MIGYIMFPTNTLTVCATCPSHLIFLYLNILTVFFYLMRAIPLCVVNYYYISAVVTQHIKSVALLQLVTFGYMFRPLPGHHQANKE